MYDSCAHTFDSVVQREVSETGMSQMMHEMMLSIYPCHSLVVTAFK